MTAEELIQWKERLKLQQKKAEEDWQKLSPRQQAEQLAFGIHMEMKMQSSEGFGWEKKLDPNDPDAHAKMMKLEELKRRLHYALYFLQEGKLPEAEVLSIFGVTAIDVAWYKALPKKEK